MKKNKPSADMEFWVWFAPAALELHRMYRKRGYLGWRIAIREAGRTVDHSALDNAIEARRGVINQMAEDIFREYECLCDSPRYTDLLRESQDLDRMMNLRYHT